MICKADSLVEGIKYVQGLVDGSMTMLLMTKEGLYAARDKYGRTPLVVGKREDGYCVSFESFVILVILSISIIIWLYRIIMILQLTNIIREDN